jgi:ankyrin repeat protein
MPIRSLPRHPSLGHLRNEARQLQRRVREGDPDALSLVREFHPRFAEPVEAFRLSDAQLTVARSYGQPSWARLKAYVETLTGYTREPHEVPPLVDAADEFLRLACLTYGGDDVTRPAQAAEMLERDPGLTSRSIYTAAVAGDAAAAAEILAADPSQATATGGPFAWEPLVYVAYSRLVLDGPRYSPVAVAQLLLRHGADPNAGYLWDGAYLFSALTGVFGYGEDAPNQPPHPQSIPLARVLLEAGADPNDDQTIYNRHFRPDNDYLELLLEHGLGGPRRGPWPARLGDHQAPPALLLEDALVFAADKDSYADRIALLLRHGVDPDGLGTEHPALEGLRPIERARLAGAHRNVELLLAAGAQPRPADPVDELVTHCVDGDGPAVEHVLAVHPELAAAAVARHPRALIDAAERGNIAAVEQFASIGYDVNRLHIGQTALHLAAFDGNREMCELLLRLGADPTIRDNAFDAPAAGWAKHAHHDELAAWLAEQAPA